MFQSILVATDGSPAAGDAVQAGINVATRFDSKVALVHVIGHGRLPHALERMLETEHLVEPERSALRRTADFSGNIAVISDGGETDAHQFRARVAFGETVLTQAKRDLRSAGIENVESFLDDGEPAERILARAEETGADLIVMGRRGLGDLKGLLLGSVTHKVAQLAQCACMTTR